nr:TetR/AcrR family transcriptional regulator C-terminal domain-containing protein [Nocardia bovistercoris]
MDAFESEIGRVEFGADTDWRDLLRLIAVAIREALISVRVQITSVDFGGVSGAEALVTIERVFAALVAAGFDPHDAGRTMTMLSEIAHTAAREAVTVTGRLLDPQAHNVVSALTEVPTDRFPTIRRVAAARDTVTRTGLQFEFDLAVIIAGLETRLENGR